MYVCMCFALFAHGTTYGICTLVKMLAKTHEMIFVQIQAQKVNFHQSEFEHHLMCGEFLSGKIVPKKIN